MVRKDDLPIQYPFSPMTLLRDYASYIFNFVTCHVMLAIFLVLFFCQCLLVSSFFFFLLNGSPTYKYCQIRNELDITAEVGPNRELAFDVASRSPPRFIILSDGAFRVNMLFNLFGL